MPLRRRSFLTAAALVPLAGCRFWPAPGLRNPCLDAALPDFLSRHELLFETMEGLRGDQLWDAHVHLAGNGDRGSGIWMNPAMQSLLHPLHLARYRFYLNAACVGAESVDEGYVARLLQLQDQMPGGARGMLLAFDYAHDEQGRRLPEKSSFHVPNNYAAAVAARSPGRFTWIASVHPYREDCTAALEWAVNNGARAVKWLPPAMGIDPAAPGCDAFYETMVRLRLPLLVHGGDERAIAGPVRQDLGNPLRLRRALDHGVRVIVAHCASLGSGIDLDAGPDGPVRPNFDLFSRLMEEYRYEERLFGEISALTQRNRLGRPLETVVTHADWHPRLINGSDYPLPAVMPVFSLGEMVKRAYINESAAVFLAEVRRHNALIFDLALKRLVRVDGHSLDPAVFHSRRVFDPGVAV